jgi:hypothetical protein
MKQIATLALCLACYGNIAAESNVPTDDNSQNPVSASTGFTLNGKAEGIFAAGNGNFAPYYIASNNHGILTQSKDALLRLSIDHKTDASRRFSYGFGVDVIGGYSSATDYLRYTANETPGAMTVQDGYLAPHSEHPSRLWLQQLYGELRYRGIFLTIGLKEHTSALLSATLSSGDLVESGNSRPIPEVRAGFNDFQDIPFTNGWVQIQGEISYGKMTDNAWMRNHYNYYDSHLNQGALYSYKRCYFRTKPAERLSVTVGMQVGAFFGGESVWYTNGQVTKTASFSKGLKQFFKIFIPSDGGLDYYSGSSLGCWDLQFRYRLNNGSTIKAYLQKPWEDGSGIGLLNGCDGIWGVQYSASTKGLISGAVVEYLDFTNQSGPMHWDPDDHPGTDITNRAEGSDDYYYNHEYNAYANYGMAIGSPFLVSPIYNTDGFLQFAANRIRGFHVGLEGCFSNELSYRLLGGYLRSWGSGRTPFITPKNDTSFMVEAVYSPRQLKALTFKAAFAMDRGTLYGNTTGGMITIAFNNIFHLSHK